MKCERCGTEESMFWYPYALAMNLFRDPTTSERFDTTQRFMLCDKCQTEFIRFMHMNPSGYYIKKDVKDEDVNYIREVMNQ
jgi:hypothetical protein